MYASTAGITGAAGADGSAGASGRTVALIPGDQSIEYNTNGASPDPSSTTITANATNTTGTVYYQFFLNDSSVQNTTSNTYSYTPQSSYANMPDKVEVQIRETSNSGTILARDMITMAGLKAGVDAITIILSNEAHTVPVTTAGSINFAGSGTSIEVYSGTSPLSYATSGNSTYNISAASDPSGVVGIGSASTSANGKIRIFANATSLSQDIGQIVFTITVRNEAGVSTAFTKAQTLTKSKQGATGAGSAGADAPKTATGQLYYQAESASAPSAPSNSGVSFNFSSGAMSGGVIGTGNTNWNVTPPLASAGQTTSKIWYVYYSVTETTAGGGTGTPTFGAVKQGTGFTNIVTFSNGDFIQSGSTITTIDGGRIAAGSTITVGSAAQVLIDGTNNRIIVSD